MIRNLYNRVLHMTQDTVCESDKTQENSTYIQTYIHTREPRTQPSPSRWPQGCREQTKQYGKDKHKTQIAKMIPKRSIDLQRQVRKLQQGLNIVHGTNLTHNPGVDQDTQMFSSHKRSLCTNSTTYHLLVHMLCTINLAIVLYGWAHPHQISSSMRGSRNFLTGGSTHDGQKTALTTFCFCYFTVYRGGPTL